MSLGTCWAIGSWAPNVWADGAWGNAPSGPEVINVMVRAIAVGFFGGLYRNIGDTFYLSTPYEYSPYWMQFIDPIPASWGIDLSLFVQHVDQEVLEFGRPADE